MNIVILSRGPKLYSTRRLFEEAKKRGHRVQIIDYLRCFINIAKKQPKVFFGQEEIHEVDGIIPRIGASQTFYGTAIVRQFEMMGVLTLNPSLAITRSRDKLRCMQILAKKNIGLPMTGCAHSAKDMIKLIQVVGGPPLIVKLLEGTQGIGVVLAETKNSAESMIEAFRGLKANILVQEYIEEAKGADIRCFVVGGEVIASMKRQGAEGEFRSNLHRGGFGSQIEITSEERTTAVLAAKAMGLEVAGVDLLRSKRGPMVMEVNSSPGLEGIEETTGVNVALAMIERLEHQMIKKEVMGDSLHF